MYPTGSRPTVGFMLGIGAVLTLGGGMRIAATAGGLVLMRAAELPLADNPFIDEHIIYAIVLVGLALAEPSVSALGGARPDPEVDGTWTCECLPRARVGAHAPGGETTHYGGDRAGRADSAHAAG
ncbi:hypothetical protein FHR32_007406 [Streptosporangium album]|uniref:Uncharacterized protein n=1 Tax=Streptosporangium album TaxID=47479 RepID=A0A7W7WDD4_9ACTN|nr:hypothetical protein [Streptosporangium album]MBB4943006.1 hypothetical protein [Streptosporangium album]